MVQYLQFRILEFPLIDHRIIMGTNYRKYEDRI